MKVRCVADMKEIILRRERNDWNSCNERIRTLILLIMVINQLFLLERNRYG